MDRYIKATLIEEKFMMNNHERCHGNFIDPLISFSEYKSIPCAKNVVEIPEGGIEDLSDGYHTFNDLYYQRMVLFAAIVKQNKELAWKSLRHEDGELCFDGNWFIVGITTPEGEYTYHYQKKYWDLFDCQELERGKHWDGHTDKDVTRLLSMNSKEVKHGEWIDDIFRKICPFCGGYFPTINITTDRFMELYHFCPTCGADMRGKAEDIEECLRQMDFEAKRLTDSIDKMQAAKGAIDVEERLRQKRKETEEKENK